MSSSVVNDIIVASKFEDVGQEVRSWPTPKIEGDPDSVRLLHLRSRSIEKRLRTAYFAEGVNLLKSYDYSSLRFDTVTRNLDGLASAMVTQLLYRGYSYAFLNNLCEKMATAELAQFVDPLAALAPIQADTTYRAFIKGSRRGETMKCLPLGRRKTLVTAGGTQINGYELQITGRDPFAALIRTVADASRRTMVTRGKASVEEARDLLKRAWCWEPTMGHGDYNYIHAEDWIAADMFVVNRQATMNASLERGQIHLTDLTDDALRALEDPLYFYQAAINAPSVEASYILLWTCLETMMGLRGLQNDIENVVANLAPAFAVGSVARRASSTTALIRRGVREFGWELRDQPAGSEFTVRGLQEWLCWLADASTNGTEADPYELFKHWPLLGRQYRELNEKLTLGKCGEILARSETNMTHQLNRLYLTRNRLVHHGSFVDGGHYQWLHLEHYVGRFLAYAVSRAIAEDLDYSTFWDEMCAEIRSQYESCKSYCGVKRAEPLTLQHVRASGIVPAVVLC